MRKNYYVKELKFLCIGLVLGQYFLVLTLALRKLGANEAAWALTVGVAMTVGALYTGSKLIWLAHHPDAKSFDMETYEIQKLDESPVRAELVMEEVDRITAENSDLKNKHTSQLELIKKLKDERDIALSKLISKNESHLTILPEPGDSAEILEKPLHLSERKSVSHIIAALADMADLDLTAPYKADEILRQSAATTGLELPSSAETVVKFFKAAAGAKAI